jgi:transketolase
MAILRLLPHMEVIQPGSRKEVDVLIRSQYNNGKTTYFRLSDHPHSVDLPVEFGKGVVIKDASATMTVMTAGPLLENVLEACTGIDVNIVYFHTLKPIDRGLIETYRHTKILVVHDAFGLYEAIAEVPHLSLAYHGIPDIFCNWYGAVPEIRKQLRLDPESIRETILTNLSRRS